MATRPQPRLQIPDKASPGDSVGAQCTWLLDMIEWTQENHGTPKEIAALSSQLTVARRLHARLSGALEVTEAQILRSVPWARIVAMHSEVFKDCPKCAARWVQLSDKMKEDGTL